MSTVAPRTASEAHLALADLTIDMLKSTREMFLKERRSLLASILDIGHEVHRMEKALTADAVPGAGGKAGDPERVYVPMHLERIGDNIEALARGVDRVGREGVPFTDRARREIDTLIEKALELLEATRDVLRTGNRTLIRHILTEGPKFEAMATEFALFHEERLIQGLCRPTASSVYLAVIDDLRGIERHEREIARKLGAEAEAHQSLHTLAQHTPATTPPERPPAPRSSHWPVL